MNINDWKIIQMRHDVKYIKKKTLGNNAANWSLVVDVFLVLLAFVLDRIFTKDETANMLWVIIAVGGLIIPIILYVFETIKIKKAEKISRRVLNTKELVAMFDDEICYMIMSAETFNTHLKRTESINSRQNALLLQFYVIEAEYYLNKAVKLILKMDNNLSGVLGESDSTRNHISKTRLNNAISLLASIYEDLFDFSIEKSNFLNKHAATLDLSDMKKHYESLKDFAINRKNSIGIDIDKAFQYDI